MGFTPLAKRGALGFTPLATRGALGFTPLGARGVMVLNFFYNLVYLLNNVIANKIVGKYWVSPPSPLGPPSGVGG